MTRSHWRRAAAITWAAATLVGPCVDAARAAVPPAVAHDAGTWDLSFEKGNRRCRLFLRSEPRGGDFALAMPAGCHKAFPTLAAVTAWSPGEGERVTFKTDAGSPVLAFAPDGGIGLSAQVGEGDTYALTPISPALQEALRTAGTAPVAAAPAMPERSPDSGVLVEQGGAARGTVTTKAQHAAVPSLPPTTTTAVAGNYAVLRQSRDTGCMVTLEPAGGARGAARARLAPACRDQGIVIFDPSAWQLLRGSELVLTARKGHSTALTRRDDTTWANAPASGAALVLKRL